MVEKQYQESNYRFTDPIRFFKANDPYYFEVDNIPLKQLQENCLWLKDQVKNTAATLGQVKRSDIEELKPYATGADRVVRVKPGRYTSRINDASTREPLAYLRKVMGAAIGDVDAWSAAAPNPGDFPGDKNAILEAALEKFKQTTAESALGMNGLVERAFTWPVFDSDRPVNNDGAELDTTKSWLSFGSFDVNIPGGGASNSPFPITEAITWAKSQGSTSSEFILPSYETTNIFSGWATFPLTESYFIKAWRGVSRLAIVDVDDEITIEVPKFDSTDFSYTDEDGQSVDVTGVTQRIDLVFIYSKPIDASGVNTIQNGSVERITRPVLGIVKGAGIKTSFEGKETGIATGYKVNTNDSILAAPGDQSNVNMGFNSTSANDIAYPIRGSFPAPDDLLNLAPLISEKLEDTAYELVGQSILPVAYVFVQESSEIVLSTDVIDIRPLFRTAELTYNERAGIGAAFPQLSLANPAVGKSQLDYELRRVYSDLNTITTVQDNAIAEITTNPLAIGYIFGGFNFGAEGALYDFYRKQFATDTETDNDSVQYIKDYVKSKYGLGSTNITIPDYPDWDLAKWCVLQDLDNKGYCPNDYINTFISENTFLGPDSSIVAGSYSDPVTPEGTTLNGDTPERLNSFSTGVVYGMPKMKYHYISKTIKFKRPANLIDYEVDFKLINCVPQMLNGGSPNSSNRALSFGSWVEKGYDEFTIYISFNVANHIEPNNKLQLPEFPSPDPGWDITNESGRTNGRKFSGFSVLTNDILYSNTAPVATGEAGRGYVGNPRVGKCTYPTVMWKMTGFTQEDAGFLYGNLNQVNPTIAIKE